MARLCPVACFDCVVVKASGGFSGTEHVTGQVLLIESIFMLLDTSEQREPAWPGVRGLEGSGRQGPGPGGEEGPSRSQTPPSNIIPGSHPVSPARSRLPRLVGQEQRTPSLVSNSRVSAEPGPGLTQSSNNSGRARQMGRRPARKPFHRGGAGQIAAHRPLLAVHTRATTSPKRDWSFHAEA